MTSLPRKFTGGKLVIASHNPGKVREIRDLLAPFGADVISAGDLNLPEPVEDGDTFIANAEIKARAAALASGFPALADDSGLAVDALDGEPGIYSARWAGPDKDFHLAMEKVEHALKAKGIDAESKRTARFICALTLCWPPENPPENSQENPQENPHCESFLGTVSGHMVWPPRGEKGFGYDPTFVPDGFDITFGEMDPEQKHSMSHRADAFAQLVDACFK